MQLALELVDSGSLPDPPARKNIANHARRFFGHGDLEEWDHCDAPRHAYQMFAQVGLAISLHSPEATGAGSRAEAVRGGRRAGGLPGLGRPPSPSALPARACHGVIVKQESLI